MKNKAYKSIRSEFETNINSWTACTNACKEMQKAYADDRKALNKVLSAMDKGDFKAAWRYAIRLGTYARDRVPESVWKLLLEKSSHLLH